MLNRKLKSKSEHVKQSNISESESRQFTQSFDLLSKSVILLLLITQSSFILGFYVVSDGLICCIKKVFVFKYRVGNLLACFVVDICPTPKKIFNDTTPGVEKS